MRELDLNLKLIFSEKISTDDDIKVIMQNVLDALVYQVNTAGMAPEDSDAFTTKIMVHNGLLDEGISHTFMDLPF